MATKKNGMQKLICLWAGYKAKEIYNLDGTGLFSRLLPNSTMYFKDEKCIGGEAPKERLTIMYFCNITGDFEKPLQERIY